MKIPKGMRERLLLLGLFVGNLVLLWRFFAREFSFVFSAPIIPMLASSLGIFDVEFRLAARVILLVFYLFGPLTLYLFVRELTGRRLSAGIAATLYSLPVFRSRFEAMTGSGDGAHVAALTLVPLAAYFLLRFLKKGSFSWSVATSIAVTLVALTSPFGLFVLLAVMVVITFSEMLLGMGRIKFMRLVTVLLFAGGLSASWYNPEFVRLTLISAPGKAVLAAIKNLIPLSLFSIPVLGAFGFLIFDKRARLQPLFVALGLTIVFSLISFAGGLAKFAVSAQSRYLSEVSFSLSILWGVVGAFLFDLVMIVPVSRWIPVPQARRRDLQKGLVFLFVIVVVVFALAFPYQETAMRERGRLITAAADSAVIDIGEIRERTGGRHRTAGFIISGITTLGMAGVWGRIKREERG